MWSDHYLLISRVARYQISSPVPPPEVPVPSRAGPQLDKVSLHRQDSNNSTMSNRRRNVTGLYRWFKWRLVVIRTNPHLFHIPPTLLIIYCNKTRVFHPGGRGDDGNLINSRLKTFLIQQRDKSRHGVKMPECKVLLNNTNLRYHE